MNFIHNKSHVCWDEQVYRDFPTDRVYDKSLFKRYIRRADILTDLSEYDALVNLRCANNDDKFRLTNAGCLFFGKVPEPTAFHTGITCVLYKGSKKSSIIDKKDFQEDVLSNLENAMIFLKQVFNIPYDVLREAIINAVTHRDYTVKDFPITIEVFDDRVEVRNPGGLPVPMGPTEFGKMSFPRNVVIAEMMLRIELIEKMGMGISKMRSLCRETGNPEPEFEYEGGFFMVVFKKPVTTRTAHRSTEKTARGTEKLANGTEKSTEKLANGTEKLANGTEKIVRLMRMNSKITTEELSKEIGISTRGIEKHIAKLKKEGRVKRIGADKGGHWKVVE